MFGNSGLMMAEFDIWFEYKQKQDEFLASLVDQDRRGRCGYVYLFEMIPMKIHMRDASITLKIGCSRDPTQRIKDVRRTAVLMPYRIREWRRIWAEDMFDAERSLHKLLAQYRLDGEWFGLPEEISAALMDLWYISGSREDGGALYFHWERVEFDTPAEFFQKAVAEFHDMSAYTQAQQRQNQPLQEPQGES